jgi:hypothetical protein
VAGESASALGLRWGVVELVVVIQSRLVCLGELLAVLLDGWCRLDPLLGYRDLQLVGADLDPAERYEGQVAVDEALLTAANCGSSVSTST